MWDNRASIFTMRIVQTPSSWELTSARNWLLTRNVVSPLSILFLPSFRDRPRGRLVPSNLRNRSPEIRNVRRCRTRRRRGPRGGDEKTGGGSARDWNLRVVARNGTLLQPTPMAKRKIEGCRERNERPMTAFRGDRRASSFSLVDFEEDQYRSATAKISTSKFQCCFNYFNLDWQKMLKLINYYIQCPRFSYLAFWLIRHLFR